MKTIDSDIEEISILIADIEQYTDLMNGYIECSSLVGVDDVEFNLIEANVKLALTYLEIASTLAYRAETTKQTGETQ